MICTATDCTTEVPEKDGVTLCGDCTSFLVYDLNQITDTLRTLQTTIARLDQGPRSERGTPGTPDPVNFHALEAKHRLTATVTEYAIRVALDTGARFTDPAGYLQEHMRHVTHQPWAGKAMAEIHHGINQCRDAADLASPRRFLGICETDNPYCGAEIMYRDGDTHTRCHQCGQIYPIREWQAYGATAAEYFIGSPAELSRALASQIRVTPGQIRKWASLGHLHRVNPETDPTGKRLKARYRLGDVVDTWHHFHQPKSA